MVTNFLKVHVPMAVLLLSSEAVAFIHGGVGPAKFHLCSPTAWNAVETYHGHSRVVHEDSFPDLSPSHVKPLRGFAEKCAIGLFLISLIDDAAAVLVRPSNSLFCLDNTFFQSLSCQIMILKAIAAPPNDRFLFIQAVFCAACTNDRTMEFTKPICSALPLEPSEVSIDPLVAEFKHNYASH